MSWEGQVSVKINDLLVIQGQKEDWRSQIDEFRTALGEVKPGKLLK
jgi:hypothetical protein